jgi:hypothetical protein
MSPLKLSLFNRDDDREEEIVELDDDDLVTKFRDTVNASPDLTMQEALRQGMQHVVDRGPTGGAGGSGA